MSPKPRTEIRFEVDPNECSVLDGYCSARGYDRTQVMRRILREWSEEKLHEATLICRTSGVNPVSPGSSRRVAE